LLSTFVVIVALSAPPERPVRLAAPAFNALNVSDKLAAFLTDHFAQRLASPQLRVTTAGEIALLLGLEKQKALFDCNDTSTNCTAELASALGVEGIVRGTVAKLGNRFTIDLKVISAADARGMASWYADASSEEEVAAKLEQAASVLAPQIHQAFRPGSAPEAVAAPAAEASASPPWPWVPATAGVAGVAAGAILVGASFSQASQLANASQPLPNPLGLRSSAELNRGLGIGLLCAGAAAGGLGTYFLMRGPAGSSVAVSAGPGGWSASIAGTLP
jgi:hypothetical protein